MGFCPELLGHLFFLVAPGKRALVPAYGWLEPSGGIVAERLHAKTVGRSSGFLHCRGPRGYRDINAVFSGHEKLHALGVQVDGNLFENGAHLQRAVAFGFLTFRQP